MPNKPQDRNKNRKDRKKKRTFHGNRYKKSESVVSDSAEGTDTTDASSSSNIASTPDVQVQVSSSAQKLNDSISQFPNVENSDEGYRLFQKSGLVSFIQTFPCPACFNISDSDSKPTFKILETLNGIDSELCIICTLCNAPVASLSNSENLNMRFQLAMTSVGCHHEKSRRFLAHMNMPPPVSFTRTSIFRDRIKRAVNEVATVSRSVAARELSEKEGSNVTVSCDGTWQRRGFSSKNGVATCLSVSKELPAKVIDTETLSNYCDSCSKAKARFAKKDDDKGLHEWTTVHRENGCMKNHDGSAGMMEPVGMMNIFQRSVSKHGLKYSGFLGDGDSKSFKHVSTADPPVYDDVSIEKYECCGHVQKRMGKRLMDLVTKCKTKVYKTTVTIKDKKPVKQSKGRRKQKAPVPVVKTTTKLVRGIGGKGKLTQAAIKRIQGHYNGAIRKNKGDLAAMKKAIWAIFHHRNGNHENCGTWCDGSDKNRLPEYVCEEMRHIFEDLSSDVLLLKCLHGGTQNANESFHHMIWERCPKEIFVSKDRLEISVDDATIVYNDGEMGRLDIFKKLNLSIGRHQIAEYYRLDKVRVKSANIQCQIKSKKKRKARSIAAAKESDNSYASGAF